MSRLTPISSRKRPSPDDGARPDDYSTMEASLTKRQRTLSPETASSSGLCLMIPGKNAPPTPPSSVTEAATMALRLVIPQEHISREQQMKLDRHKADAERWKPKLQRPYPKWSEIKNAYNLKLMRHYPDTTAQIQPNFVRPKIDKSPRVSRLLQQFPLIDTIQLVRGTRAELIPSPATPLDQAIPLSARMKDLKETRLAHPKLQTNIQITETEYAQRLAWQSFSLPEQGRVDRGREAMIQSGLITDDLRLEVMCRPNKLPDWKKAWTGRFAVRRQVAG